MPLHVLCDKKKFNGLFGDMKEEEASELVAL